MPRRVNGEIIERPGKTGVGYQLRFTAYGRRESLTLNSRDGWTREKGEVELANILADVRRGTWRPHAASVAPEPPDDPTFHDFASQWIANQSHLGERTVEDYTWALSSHLLPFFADHRLSQITVAEVDRYKAWKVRERELPHINRPLSNNSINKTIKRLAQILDVAVEYGHLAANPASGRRRRLKGEPPRRARLESEQVATLLEVAGQHRALLATAIMAGGLRVSELTGLRWRDVNLAGHRLTVAQSKTEAGRRQVDLNPDLRDELASHKASSPFNAPDDFVFPTRQGTRRDRNTVRTRILYPAIERANARLQAAGRAPISPSVTFHSLRRTFASLLAESGADAAYTMAQIGHKSPALTLGIYTDVGNRRHSASEQLGALLRGLETAHNGTNPAESGREHAASGDPFSEEVEQLRG
jgi:integrase